MQTSHEVHARQPDSEHISCNAREIKELLVDVPAGDNSKIPPEIRLEDRGSLAADRNHPEPISPMARTVRCAYPTCGKPCLQGTIPCQRPVVTYADPLRLTLLWFRDMLRDEVLAHEAANDPEFNALVAYGYKALVIGELETAESHIEQAVQRFSEIQKGAFLSRLKAGGDGHHGS